jgi:hypothetical protein
MATEVRTIAIPEKAKSLINNVFRIDGLKVGFFSIHDVIRIAIFANQLKKLKPAN